MDFGFCRQLSKSEAKVTASMIFTYPVQRQRLLFNPFIISAGEGDGFPARSAFVAMIIPGVQKPHWTAAVDRNAS